MAEEQKNEEQTTEPVPEHTAEMEPEHKPAPKEGHQGSKLDRFKAWYGERKKWTIPATVLLVVLILAAVPFTRYNLAGIVLKRNLSIKVLDSTTNTPVSGASVSFGSVSAQTDSSGNVTISHVKVGNHKVLISKKYYQDKSISVMVPIFSQKSEPSAQLTATGRQVKVTVTNRISKQPLENVSISAAGTTSKTDKNGSAIIVLPVGTTEQKADLSLDGYNNASVTIKVSNDKIQENDLSLTPSGKVYFLSKLSGRIDVVKTNLDGTDRKTVLAGTGKEDDRNTVLLASRDWKYLALLSKRAGGNNPSIYLIDTSNDNLSTIDEGSASFTLVGWVDDSFVYSVTRDNVQPWQPGGGAIKSFNAAAKKIVVLDQTEASGTGTYDYASEQVGDIYGYDGQVYYIMNWNISNQPSQASVKQATFNSVKTDGTAKKTIRSFGLSSVPAYSSYVNINVNERVEKPDKIHLYFYDGNGDKFYIYAGGQVKEEVNQTYNTLFSADYSTYLQSPSDKNTFWSESRDGKNTLFIGDEEGENGKQIAALSEYNTYGWYTDDYLLVSKNSSELYAMSKDAKTVVKISDYHKPSQTFVGYGGGYGGF
jgi:hypothetical protein